MLFFDNVVRRALEEDLVHGDITSSAVIPAGLTGEGILVSKSRGIIAGIAVIVDVFNMVDPSVRVETLLEDGDSISNGSVIAEVQGNTRSILCAERVALNFLQRLSGIATATAQAVAEAKPYGCIISDTRKTGPGMRWLEKYAVSVGGGKNHRFGLYDAVLIKDNHVKAAGGVIPAVSRARQHNGHLVKVEVEVENMEQVQEALQSGADVIMLDNMSIEDMERAVGEIGDRALVEASGQIQPGMIARVASTGVGVISLGWITHSALPLDISLDLK